MIEYLISLATCLTVLLMVTFGFTAYYLTGGEVSITVWQNLAVWWAVSIPPIGIGIAVLVYIRWDSKR